ncbi:MAG: cytochrome b/b6 domain-containing protein [Proteobacteria bacterium]|nr:cytochrome b/b6 domain-containing protein [Pseudomonadota bacterium]
MDRRVALRPVKVWDAPVRLFHWAIVLLVGFSWLSIEESWMQLHFLSGYTILALLIFRIVWGVIGSDTARFSRFLGSPAAALRHLSHFRRREPDLEVGHNAAGGWMVLLMLLLLLVQAGSGLFANDDVMNEGPLAHLAGKALSDRLTSLHGLTFTLVQIAVLLHVLAVIAYAVVKRQDLVRPMVTGVKRLPATVPAPRLGRLWTALSLLGAAALAVVLLVNVAGR